MGGGKALLPCGAMCVYKVEAGGQILILYNRAKESGKEGYLENRHFYSPELGRYQQFPLAWSVCKADSLLFGLKASFCLPAAAPRPHGPPLRRTVL